MRSQLVRFFLSSSLGKNNLLEQERKLHSKSKQKMKAKMLSLVGKARKVCNRAIVTILMKFLFHCFLNQIPKLRWWLFFLL